MRLSSLVTLVGALAACSGAREVSGLYVRGPSTGAFFPCDGSRGLWQVADTGLANRYRQTATRPFELVFVRMRGVRVDSSGIYGPAGHGAIHFVVQRLEQVRRRRAGECSASIASASTVLDTTLRGR